MYPMRLRHPGTVDLAIDQLRRLHNDASNVVSTWPIRQPGYLDRAKGTYLEWIENATLTIENNLDDDELLTGLCARAYWRIYDLTEDDPQPYTLVRHEIRHQQRRIEAVIAHLEHLRRFIDREGSIVVPDTSAFIERRDFKELDWAGLDIRPLPVRLVVPVLVIEQLERVKDFDRGDKRHIARRVLKELREVFRDVKPGEAAELRKNVTIEALIDEDSHVRLENEDGEIIDQALQLHLLTGRTVTIAALDPSMELRTRLRGIDVVICARQGRVQGACPGGWSTLADRHTTHQEQFC